MAHRTRRCAVRREAREFRSEREDVRLSGIMSDKIMRGDRLRWSDIPDGPRVAVKYCEVVFAKGVIAK